MSELLWTTFNPREVPAADGARTRHFGDESLITKINVALALGRPLLLTGEAGVGKSSVARGVADYKGWALMAQTVTSRMDAADLKAELDAVGRLGDANIAGPRADLRRELYVTPGVLWQAYDPHGTISFLKDHGSRQPPVNLRGEAWRKGRVLLIDEIDKGDLDFSNDLLDVFDEGQFERQVLPGKVKRAKGPLLVVLTSNGERDFSPAFLRRTIAHDINAPPISDAEAIGQAHLARRQREGAIDENGAQRVSARLADLAAMTVKGDDPTFSPINVAEFVDLIDAAALIGWAENEWQAFRGALDAFAKSRRNMAEQVGR